MTSRYEPINHLPYFDIQTLDKEAPYSFTVQATPLSVNHYLGTNGKHRYVKPAGLAFKELVALTAPKPYPVFDRDVVLHIAIVRPANRGDIDNFFKLCLDSLKGIAYDDDKRIKIMQPDMLLIDKGNPRVTFTVCPIDNLLCCGYNLHYYDDGGHGV